jgi:hypothetical protein
MSGVTNKHQLTGGLPSRKMVVPLTHNPKILRLEFCHWHQEKENSKNVMRRVVNKLS